MALHPRSPGAWALALLALAWLPGCSKHTYRNDGAGFAVDLPIDGKPEDRSRLQDGIELHSWELHDAVGHFYRVGYADLPGPADPVAVYDGKRQDLTRGHGVIDREEDAYVGNLLGRGYFWHGESSGTSVSGWSRMFLKDRRVYQVMFFAPENVVDTVAIDTARKFMGSFRFVGAGADGSP